MQIIQLQVLIASLVGIISAEIEFIAVRLPLKVKSVLIVLFSREKRLVSKSKRATLSSG